MTHALAPEDVIRQKVKAELRKRMRGVRKTMPAEACAARSEKIVERLLPFLARARSVALFWPITDRHEVDLRPLDPLLRARGVTVAYPTIGETEMFFRAAAADELEEKGFGFAEPPETAPRIDVIDVIVVPALAADPSGHRIGYGAGYYDRTLPRYPSAKTIGVIFDWQLVAEVPALPNDVRVGCVVTDVRTFNCDA
jgi:5-formyltetrahydrofolate cyclo-ligase